MSNVDRNSVDGPSKPPDWGDRAALRPRSRGDLQAGQDWQEPDQLLGMRTLTLRDREALWPRAVSAPRRRGVSRKDLPLFGTPRAGVPLSFVCPNGNCHCRPATSSELSSETLHLSLENGWTIGFRTSTQYLEVRQPWPVKANELISTSQLRFGWMRCALGDGQGRRLQIIPPPKRFVRLTGRCQGSRLFCSALTD